MARLDLYRVVTFEQPTPLGSPRSFAPLSEWTAKRRQTSQWIERIVLYDADESLWTKDTLQLQDENSPSCGINVMQNVYGGDYIEHGRRVDTSLPLHDTILEFRM
jgi:hypothetical protein